MKKFSHLASYLVSMRIGREDNVAFRLTRRFTLALFSFFIFSLLSPTVWASDLMMKGTRLSINVRDISTSTITSQTLSSSNIYMVDPTLNASSYAMGGVNQNGYASGDRNKRPWENCLSSCLSQSKKDVMVLEVSKDNPLQSLVSAWKGPNMRWNGRGGNGFVDHSLRFRVSRSSVSLKWESRFK